MRLHMNSLASVFALAISTAAVAQAQQPPAQETTSTTTQQSPTQTQTTTTDSTTTAVPGTTATPAQTQTTTTKSTTTTPTDSVTGQPVGPSTTATTTSTTKTDSAAASGAASATDVKKGVLVFDQSGGSVGKIESVSGKTAVVDTGSVKASIPISSFAKNDKGLVIAMTKEQIDAAAKKASPKPKKG